VYDALVLAGGKSRRLGGAHKPGLVVGGRTMLDAVLGATSGAGVTVVVGPRQPTYRPVEFTSEDPPGGGPAAAVVAGLRLVTAPTVVVVAADLPYLDPGTVARLAEAAPAMLVDTDGRDQWLCGAWPTDALRAVAGEGTHGTPLRRLLAPLEPVRMRSSGDPWRDVDTVDDLRRAWGMP
jgi:molybdopterin-guanine dinucleotide biosynthesis protein A